MKTADLNHRHRSARSSPLTPAPCSRDGSSESTWSRALNAYPTANALIKLRLLEGLGAKAIAGVLERPEVLIRASPEPGRPDAAALTVHGNAGTLR